MAATNHQEASRNVAIGFITTDKTLSINERKLLQASLQGAGYFKGPLNGTLDSRTGKAIAEFLSANENRIYARNLSSQIQRSIDLHLAQIKTTPASSKQPAAGFTQKFSSFFNSRPGTCQAVTPAAEPYGGLFRGVSSAPRKIGNPNIEDVLAYPGAFDSYNIKRLQTALGAQEPDGHFDHHTQDKLSDYLKKNPEIYTTISPSALRLMLNNPDNAA